MHIIAKAKNAQLNFLQAWKKNCLQEDDTGKNVFTDNDTEKKLFVLKKIYSPCFQKNNGPPHR